MQKWPTQCPAYWWKFKKYKMLFSDCSGSHLLKGHKLPQNKQLIQCSLSSVSTTHHEMPQSTHMIKICPIQSKETMFLSRFFSFNKLACPYLAEPGGARGKLPNFHMIIIIGVLLFFWIQVLVPLWTGWEQDMALALVWGVLVTHSSSIATGLLKELWVFIHHTGFSP